jgi:hypothetical protein
MKKLLLFTLFCFSRFNYYFCKHQGMIIKTATGAAQQSNGDGFAFYNRQVSYKGTTGQIAMPQEL